MYQTDSFFTLTPLAQAGLLVAALIHAAAMIVVLRLVSRGRSLAIRLLTGLAGILGFVWLAPQYYYGYYLLIFDALPLQWVIAPYPDPVSVLQILFFQGKATLSGHAQGVLGWICLICAVLNHNFTGRK